MEDISMPKKIKSMRGVSPVLNRLLVMQRIYNSTTCTCTQALREGMLNNTYIVISLLSTLLETSHTVRFELGPITVKGRLPLPGSAPSFPIGLTV